MIFKEMFEKQKELDDKIIIEHKLQNKDLFDKKIIALIVEISELANEIRFFKFWSTKPMSEKEIVLEEFVDCLHFVLSIGNDINIGFLQEIDYNFVINYDCFTDIFIEIIGEITRIKALRDCGSCKNLADTYIHVFELLLTIGAKLGFDNKDIEMAYYKKNDVNLKRQDDKY